MDNVINFPTKQVQQRDPEYTHHMNNMSLETIKEEGRKRLKTFASNYAGEMYKDVEKDVLEAEKNLDKANQRVYKRLLKNRNFQGKFDRDQN